MQISRRSRSRKAYRSRKAGRKACRSRKACRKAYRSRKYHSMIGGTKKITVLPPFGQKFANDLLSFNITIADNASEEDIIQMIKKHPSNSYKNENVTKAALDDTYFISPSPSVYNPESVRLARLDADLAALRADG